jgi:hypothetical protein
MQLRNNLIAQHGYTVDWGHFNGVCMGANGQPLELDKSMTEQIVKELREDVAPRADKLAADLRSGAVTPKWFMRVSTGERRFGVPQYKDVECTRADIDDATAARQIDIAFYAAQSKAKGARAHANDLEKLIPARHGQPLYPVGPEKKELLKVGSRVLIGGKKGEIYEVVKLDYAICRGCGPYMNGKHMLHAFFLSKSGQQWGIPARSIRASAIQI